jgi:Fe-S-cluster containining protein
MDIIRNGHVGHQHLITLRKGERVMNPAVNKLEKLCTEMIRLRGKGQEWTCFFYNEHNSSCGIYKTRFLECRLLKCWAPAELIAIIGKDTIVRKDIMNPGDPVIELIEEHERECPGEEVEDLILKASRGVDTGKYFIRLGELVMKDEAIRTTAISEMGLKKEYELFIFGRPVAGILRSRGFSVRSPETRGK